MRRIDGGDRGGLTGEIDERAGRSGGGPGRGSGMLMAGFGEMATRRECEWKTRQDSITVTATDARGVNRRIFSVDFWGFFDVWGKTGRRRLDDGGIN